MKKIYLKYHFGMDLCWVFMVNVVGILMAYYLWWRIKDLSCFELNMIILSVAIGYIGFSLLWNAIRFHKKAQKMAKIVVGEDIEITDFSGHNLKGCKKYKVIRSPMQIIFGICDLYLLNTDGKKVVVKNVSIKIKEHLHF